VLGVAHVKDTGAYDVAMVGEFRGGLSMGCRSLIYLRVSSDNVLMNG
jgi:hypothetical protein